ncbi:MAG: GFA family protein [Hyphomicrobiaceae bacterium]
MVSGENSADVVISGRCYCGATTIAATQAPTIVAYCHCVDCRRVTGAPVAAFAAFDETAVRFSPTEGQQVSVNAGATRTFCPQCGSPLAGRYDYLPGQIYIALGILDQANDLAPNLHAHEGQRLTWLHIDDDLERIASTSRACLSGAAD